MHDRYESRSLRVTARNRWMLGLAASLLLLSLVPIFSMEPFRAQLFSPAFLVLSFGYLMWRTNVWPRMEKTPVTADRAGLRIGARFYPRSELTTGHLVPPRDSAPPRVMIERRHRWTIAIEVSGMDEGRAILRALGLGASQSVAKFLALSPLIAKRPYLAILASMLINIPVQVLGRLALHSDGPVILWVLLLLACFSLSMLLLVQTNVLVGADGLEVRWLWKKRFLAYREIARVAAYEKGWGLSKSSGVKLVLEFGESIRLAIINQRKLHDRTLMLRERIHEARTAYRAGGTEAAALLGREGRGISEWITSLRALGAGANADMRTAPVPRERLFRIVEDPALDATSRAAAAVALGTDLDAGGRARLRAAAEATVAPKLRFAIEKAADTQTAEDGAIEAALTEIEAEGAKLRPR